MPRTALAATLAAFAVSSTAFAGVNGVFVIPRAAPTLGEVGLGLLVVLLGAVGGYLARRKK